MNDDYLMIIWWWQCLDDDFVDDEHGCHCDYDDAVGSKEKYDDGHDGDIVDNYWQNDDDNNDYHGALSLMEVNIAVVHFIARNAVIWANLQFWI